MLKKLFLCRHGESEYNAKGIIQGHIDTYLTPKGIVQARLTGEYLKNFNIQKIYTSDLRRAYQTATIIGDVLGIEPLADERIREMNFGQWEGRCYDEIFLSNKEEWEKWLKNPVAYPLPSQEEFHIFEERIKDFLNEIKKQKEERVLIVAHGGSIQGMICIETGIGLENIWALRHTNTGISLLEYDNTHINAVLKFFNYNHHLENLESKTQKGII